MAIYFNILANQTQNLAAILQNFNSALGATESALNSAGSAVNENSKYMDSIAAKTTAVKAAFEALSNSVIDSGLVKAVLDLSKGFLELANTGVGPFIIQAGLLGGVLWGGKGLITAMNLIPSLLGGFAKGAAGATASVGLLNKALGLTAPQLFLIATAISAVINVAPKIISWFKNLTGDTETLSNNIGEATTKLEENAKKLQDLNNIPYGSRTDEIQAEINKLEEENRVLVEQIDLMKQRLKGENLEKLEKDTKFKLQDQLVYNIKVQGTDEVLGAISSIEVAQGKLAHKMKELGVDVDLTKGSLEDYGYTLEQTKVTYKSTEESIGIMVSQYNQLETKLQNTGILTVEEKAKFEQLHGTLISYQQAVKDTGATYSDLSEGTIANIENIKELDSRYLEAMDSLYSFRDANDDTVVALTGLENSLAQASSGMTIQKGQVDLLINAYPQLKELISETTGGFKLETTALINSANAGNSWAITIVKAQQEATKKTIEETEKRIKALTAEMNAIKVQGRIGYTDANKEAIKQYNDYFKAITAAQGELAKLKKSAVLDWEMPEINTGSTVAETGKKAKNAEKELTAQEKISKEYDAQLELMEARLDVMKASDAPLEKQVELLRKMQELVHLYAEALRSLGLTDETSVELSNLGKLWWDYENQIKDMYDDLDDASKDSADNRADNEKDAAKDAEEAWRDSMQAQIDAMQKRQNAYEAFFDIMVDNIDKEIQKLEEEREATEKYWDDQVAKLEKRQEAYEALFDIMVDKIDGEIKGLEDQKDDIEKYWDDQIDKIKETNDALDEQIKLQQLQEALARAKATKKLVYSEGQFQYMEDTEAIGKAQADLDTYNREQEIKDLEAQKENALAEVDKQIEEWEKYKDAWSSVVDNYKDKQDILLIEQQLGVKLEGDAWKDRLDNLDQFANGYESTMDEIVEIQTVTKDKELALIDEQIKNWQNYKDQWSSVVENYQKKQEELLVLEELGIKLEGEAWRTRLDNLATYVKEYEDLMGRLTSAQNALNAGYQGGGSGKPGGGSGSSGGGGGGKPSGGSSGDKGNGTYLGWTTDELKDYADAQNKRDEATTDEEREYWDKVANDIKDKANSKTNKQHYGTFVGEDEDGDRSTHTSQPGKTPVISKGPNMSRDPSKAGQTVQKGSYTITYDENGYAKKATKTSRLEKKKKKKYADGTLSASGGLSLVGERGPELRVLNSGDGILPSEVTKNLWKWGKMNPDKNVGTSISIGNITLPSVRNGNDFVKELKNLAYQRAYKRS